MEDGLVGAYVLMSSCEVDTEEMPSVLKVETQNVHVVLVLLHGCLMVLDLSLLAHLQSKGLCLAPV